MEFGTYGTAETQRGCAILRTTNDAGRLSAVLDAANRIVVDG